MPINNNKSQVNLIVSNTNNTSNTPIINKKQIATVRSLKEDLELLIQRLRNLQKQRQNGNVSNLEQFIKLVQEFNEKSSQEISLVSVISMNENNPSLISQDIQLQLRQLQSSIKQTCSQLVNASKHIESSLSSSAELNSKQLDANLSQLSKSFNEFMHILDKLNNQNSLTILKTN